MKIKFSDQGKMLIIFWNTFYCKSQFWVERNWLDKVTICGWAETVALTNLCGWEWPQRPFFLGVFFIKKTELFFPQENRVRECILRAGQALCTQQVNRSVLLVITSCQSILPAGCELVKNFFFVCFFFHCMGKSHGD